MVKKINDGELTPTVELGLAISFAEGLKGDILQRFHRNEIDKMDKRFIEFVLIGAVRMLLGIPPVTFYDYLRHNEELRNVSLLLQHLYGQCERILHLSWVSLLILLKLRGCGF